MKNKIKTFSTISIITAILVFVTVFAGCNNSCNSETINNTQKVEVKFSTTIADSARSGGNTVLPDNVTNDDITKIILTAKKRTGDSAPYSYEDYTFDNNETSIEWLAAGGDSAYDKMTADSVTFLCDTYQFTIELYIDDDSGITPPYKLIQQGATEDITINPSLTNVTISTHYVEAGDFSYTIIFNTDCKDTVKKLTVGLFTKNADNSLAAVSVGGTTYDLTSVTLENWTDEASNNVKKAVFQIQNLPKGQYYLKYIVYYDAAGTTPRAWFGPLSVLANGYKNEQVVRLSKSDLNSYSNADVEFTFDNGSLDFVIEMVSDPANPAEESTYINYGEYKIYAQKADGTKVAPEASDVKLFKKGVEVNSNCYTVTAGTEYTTIAWDDTHVIPAAGRYAIYAVAQNNSVSTSIYKDITVSKYKYQPIDIENYSTAAAFQTALETIRDSLTADTQLVISGDPVLDETDNTSTHYFTAMTNAFADYEGYLIGLNLYNLNNISVIKENDFGNYDCSAIESLIIPSGITEIQMSAFNLPGLTSLTIIDNGTDSITLKKTAISLENLKQINIIDKGNIVIENGAIAWAPCLKKINLIQPVGTTSNYLMTSNEKFLLRNDDTTGTNPHYTLLKGINCKSFTLGHINVIVSKTYDDLTSLVTVIGDSAFDATCLNELGTLGNNVTTVEDYAFGDCTFNRVDIYNYYDTTGYEYNVFAGSYTNNLNVYVAITESNYQDFKNYIYSIDSGGYKVGLRVQNVEFMESVVLPAVELTEEEISNDDPSDLALFRVSATEIHSYDYSGWNYFTTIKFNKSASIGPGQFKNFYQDAVPTVVGEGTGSWYSSSTNTYPDVSGAMLISNDSDLQTAFAASDNYIYYIVSD